MISDQKKAAIRADIRTLVDTRDDVEVLELVDLMIRALLKRPAMLVAPWSAYDSPGDQARVLREEIEEMIEHVRTARELRLVRTVLTLIDPVLEQLAALRETAGRGPAFGSATD